MKKNIIKVAVFLVLFVACFFSIQYVLRYRFTTEYVYTRNMVVKEPEQFDVIYLGTSEIYAGLFPTATYEAEGITGFNMAVADRSPIINYYQLKYILKYQTPKVLVCDFCALYNARLPGKNEEFEVIYRKLIDAMPDMDIKKEMIDTLCEEDPGQNKLSYWLPMLRYHSIWNKLSEDNFKDTDVFDETFPRYSAGCHISPKFVYKDEKQYSEIYEITPSLWDVPEDYKDEKLSARSCKYYDMMLDLCREKGITVVCVMPPKPREGALKTARLPVIQEYLADRGVDFIDYNTYEEIDRLGLELLEDFYDAAHLNAKGAVKLSRDLAAQLKERYKLEDHRGDSAYAHWDGYWTDFLKAYDLEGYFQE